MKFPRFPRKKTSEEVCETDEMVLAQARELAAHRLEQYIADRRTSPATTDGLRSIRKSTTSITRLPWW
jgi:hypothetical protein